MPWRIFAFSRPAGTDRGHATAVIPFACATAATENEARRRAMRLYQQKSVSVTVRPPEGLRTISGPDLEEWLTDRLSGPVRD